MFRTALFCLPFLWFGILPATGADEIPIDYTRDIVPVFTKYCAGCHNDADHEGHFSLETYASLQQGTEDGPALLPGDLNGSLIWRLVNGRTEPKMPPEGEPAPNAEEIEKLRLWIEQGAKGPDGAEPDRLMLKVPHIASHVKISPITGLALSPDGSALAVARFGEVSLFRKSPTTMNWEPSGTLDGFPGKINAVHFCQNGTRLVTASGVEGAGGISTLWEWPALTRIRDFKGHRDAMHDAEVSPDGKILATCGHDKEIILWDVESGAVLRTLSGHNGAVYDLAFSPDGNVLASASADDTCKLWRVADGERLDTLGQPLKEQYSIEFSPDGKFVVAAGADNRIRVWQFVSHEKPRINPLIHARFAHEAPIVRLAFSPDGTRLISAAEDRTVKVWDTRNYTEIRLLENEPDLVTVIGIQPDNRAFVVGRLDGSWESRPLPAVPTQTGTPQMGETVAAVPVANPAPMGAVQEQEPNTVASAAQGISVPAVIKGTIHADSGKDEDFFRFSAKQGEEWVVEVNAARSKSPLDSYLEILTLDGRPIERMLLQAVRDSYFTFRGKNGTESGDFRVFNWEEMDLNEYLFANGEVVKLWLYPRGPDSGFLVYPGTGSRWGYFDTTPLAHALGEPCYIVHPYPPGSELIPNGLPVFPIYYENDDESRRELGSDSKLIFTAPADGEYLIRLRDVRGQQGPNYTYELTVRPRQPDFRVNIDNRKLSVYAGSATEIRFRASRADQFDGPIQIQVAGLPAGLTLAAPIVIEEGQIQAFASLVAAPGQGELTPEQVKQIQFQASATIGGKAVVHEVPGLDELKIPQNPPVTVAIQAAPNGVQPLNPGGAGPLEFVIEPGETIMLKVVANRHSHPGEIPFGNEDSGRNLPHGTFVDNIGLNGLLLLSDQNEREFFVTAAKWVPEQSRLFHLKTNVGGEQTTPPVILHVRKKENRVAESN